MDQLSGSSFLNKVNFKKIRHEILIFFKSVIAIWKSSSSWSQKSNSDLPKVNLRLSKNTIKITYRNWLYLWFLIWYLKKKSVGGSKIARVGNLIRLRKKNERKIFPNFKLTSLIKCVGDFFQKGRSPADENKVRALLPNKNRVESLRHVTVIF